LRIGVALRWLWRSDSSRGLRKSGICSRLMRAREDHSRPARQRQGVLCGEQAMTYSRNLGARSYLPIIGDPPMPTWSTRRNMGVLPRWLWPCQACAWSPSRPIRTNAASSRMLESIALPSVSRGERICRRTELFQKDCIRGRCDAVPIRTNRRSCPRRWRDRRFLKCDIEEANLRCCQSGHAGAAKQIASNCIRTAAMSMWRSIN